MTVFAVLVILLSAYILSGRYVMTQAGGWVAPVEEGLSELVGMPVRIGALQGGWRGLGPTLAIEDLQLMAADGSPTLALSRVSLSLDMPASLLNLQWMAGRIRVRDLDLTLHEQIDGNWRLAGLGSTRMLSVDDSFRLLTRLGDVEVLDTRVRFAGLDQRALQFDDLALLFQSRGGRHRLQANAWLPGDPRRVTLQAALDGRSVSELSGSVYARIPENDLALFAGLLEFGTLQVEELDAGMEVWADFRQSRLQALDVRAQAQRLSVYERRHERTVGITGLDGVFHYRRDGDNHRAWIDSLRFQRDGDQWQSGRGWFEWQDNQQFRLRAERLDAGMLSPLLRDLGLVSGQLRTELETLNPRGSVEALAIEGGMDGGRLRAVSVSGNLTDARVDARGMAPAVWGADGYAEFLYTADSGRLTGSVEVDSTDLSLHLPRLFDDVWSYTHVNGRINVRLDTRRGADLRVSSSVITAESDLISGRAQFATTFRAVPDSEPEIGLELMVGALQGDASGKSAYLPMGPGAPPGIQGILGWIDRSVLGGEAGGSGFVFRGQVQRGSSPEDRTMQMFYRVRDGVLRFDPDWPALEEINGLVVVDGADVDVDVRAGSSLGIRFSETRAEVRPNSEGSGGWLTVNGQGTGTAPRGLEYLRRTPVTEGLGNYLAGWETSGDVDFALDLELPLFIEDAEPEISLTLGIDDNEAMVPDYQLELEQISGTVRYSTVEGLSSEGLRARVFDSDVALDLESLDWSGGLNDTALSAEGNFDVDSLRQWSLIPPVVERMLQPVGGTAAVDLRLELPEVDDRTMSPVLTVNSDLSGVSLGYPAPLGKASEDAWPSRLELSFLDGGGSRVQLRMSDLATLNARLSTDGTIESGLLFLGPPGDGVRVRRFDDSTPGLQVLGRVSYLPLRGWLDYYDDHLSPATGMPGAPELRELAGLVDVNVDRLDLFDQEFSNVNVQLDQEPEGARLALASEHLGGALLFPADRTAPLVAEFARIHIDADSEAGEDTPGSVSGDEEVRFEELDPVEYVMPRTDPLADVDPRTFPAMRFSVDDLQVGNAEYGQWSFSLQPRDDSVVFDDLQVTSRGLQIGTEEEPARFVWYYDGASHESELEGSVKAGDLAPVLSAYGYAPVLESGSARFDVRLDWDGTPAFVSAVGVRGEVDLALDDGRFRGGTGAGNSALKLISIINFDALIRRLRVSDDLLREGLAYEEIRGTVFLNEGVLTIEDRLQIIGPSSLFQLSGSVNLPEETIDGNLYITLPVSDNLPWVSGLAVLNNLINWQVAVGVFVLDQIFGDQVDSLTSAQYTLQGPWETLQPRLTQVFSTGGEDEDDASAQP
ncbi:MAG: YhdP family protein [Pseudohongiellaceae bacterium]